MWHSGYVLFALGACSFELRPGAGPEVDAPPHDTIDADLTPRTVIFRDGLDGYTGTRDSYISDNVPGPHGTETTFIWDLNPDAEHGLLQFTTVFGSGATQIPPGSTIMEAKLLVVVVEPTANIGMMREAAVAWDEATTWATFGAEPGVQTPDVREASLPAPTTGVSTVDVTGAVARWSANPAENHGWVFSPGGSDGCDVASREATVADNRPTLTVTFVPPP